MYLRSSTRQTDRPGDPGRVEGWGVRVESVENSTGAKKVLAEGAAFPFPTAFFNDAAADPDGKSVYVTEMGQRGKIRDPMTALWPTDSPQAAEIVPEARIYKITVPEGVVSVAVDKTPDMLVVNGVTAPAAGRLLVASSRARSGSSSKGQNEKILLEMRGKGSTADFFLDKPGKRLIVPDTSKGSLIYLPI